jgi:hypothetical protein
MVPAAFLPPARSPWIDTHPTEMEFLLTAILPAPLPAALQLLSRSFVIQALLATATIAVVSASSPVATADPAVTSPAFVRSAAR